MGVRGLGEGVQSLHVSTRPPGWFSPAPSPFSFFFLFHIEGRERGGAAAGCHAYVATDARRYLAHGIARHALTQPPVPLRCAGLHAEHSAHESRTCV